MAEPYIEEEPEDWRRDPDDPRWEPLDPQPEIDYTPLPGCRCLKFNHLGQAHAEPWAIAASNKAMISYILEVPLGWVDDYIEATLNRLARTR